MPISKNSISSPLEAGTSLLQPMQLPSELLEALDYVSKRLVRKRLHISLIVVKKDNQIQSPIISRTSTAPGSHSLTTSPSSHLYNNAPLTSHTRSISPTSRGTSPLSSHASSPTSAIFSNSLSSRSNSTTTSTLSTSTSTIYLSRTKYPGLPSSPKDTPAQHMLASLSPPSTPCSPTTDWISPNTPNRYGITLMHSTTLSPRAERILRSTITRAERKYPAIGGNWLQGTSLSAPISDVSTRELIRNSLRQNRVVYTSPGLELLAMDGVFGFKCMLHGYSRSLSSEDMGLAIDELRRLVLVRGGKIGRAEVMRCYEWVGISLSALCDVEEGYRRIYGGEMREGAIFNEEVRERGLCLKTVFMKEEAGEEEELVEVGESAKGKDGESPIWERIGGDGEKEDRGPFLRGEKTPNRAEDVSPGTRGEWECLMRGERRFTLIEVDC